VNSIFQLRPFKSVNKNYKRRIGFYEQKKFFPVPGN
jgi:hypothetical protein